MGCGCGGRAGVGAKSNRGTTLGWRAFLPNGEVVPPRDKAPFLMAAEAVNEVSLARGGTVLRIEVNDAEDAYAIAKREAAQAS